MWELVQSRGDASNWQTPYAGFQTKKLFLSLHPWWLSLTTKWYERTPTRTYSRNWQDPESCRALLEWLGLANPEWLVSWLGRHAHPSHQSCQKCISLAHNLCCHKVWRTCQTWWRCSSQISLKIKISSKYTTTNALVKGCKMLSISLMKVVGAFINPNTWPTIRKGPPWI